MSVTGIIAELDAQIARLEQVKRLLSKARSGQLGDLAANKIASQRKRRLSPEARKKISEAQRRRWAARKSKK
jgi:hypothetical protein